MSGKLEKEVQDVVDRMARNDPTMTEAKLYGECAAADGAAAFVVLQMHEARVRGVDCVCATEPPCSSENDVGDEGCAALARALEKNTTLQELNLGCEFVVLWLYFWEGGLVVGHVLWDVVGYVVGVEGRVRGVDCVCATEPPSSSAGVSPAVKATIWSLLQRNRQV